MGNDAKDDRPRNGCRESWVVQHMIDIEPPPSRREGYKQEERRPQQLREVDQEMLVMGV